MHSWLIEGNGYETRQSSLLQDFVRFFDLDRTQNREVVYLPVSENLINRNVLVT